MVLCIYTCKLLLTLQWNRTDPGSIYAEPFELKPAMFTLNAGEVTTLEVT